MGINLHVELCARQDYWRLASQELLLNSELPKPQVDMTVSLNLRSENPVQTDRKGMH